ncbi:hypothetical protein QBC35DRAFT_453565, partial [Podospora australis]
MYRPYRSTGPRCPARTAYAAQATLRPTIFRVHQPAKRSIDELLHNDEIARKLCWADLQYYIGGFERWGYRSSVIAMQKAGYKRAIPPRRVLLTRACKAK